LSKFKSQKEEQVQEEEPVRKRGLPPLFLGFDERGQAPLPDLFFFLLVLLPD
jgi:hypothetical protein